MILINGRMFSESFIFQLKHFLHSRGFLRGNNNKILFDTEMQQGLIEFQNYKRLKIADGNLTPETFQALGKEMSAMQVDVMTRFDSTLKGFFIPQDIIEGIYITGEASDRKKILEIFKRMMGNERMVHVSVMSASVSGMGEVIRLASSLGSAAKITGIGDDEDNRFFSEAMADILGSNQIVEIQIAKSFQHYGMVNIPLIGRRNFGTVTETTAYYGGGATLNKDESLSGNVQIFIHPTGDKLAEARLAPFAKFKSSDELPLEYTLEIVLAHELGHAYSSVKFGHYVEESVYALKMENAMCSRGSSKRRRTGH